MHNQAPLYQSDSSILSSISSYSQIIPREEPIVKLRKDRPIVIRSIPISKQRVHGNNSVKQQQDEMAKTVFETNDNLVDGNNIMDDKVEEVKGQQKVEIGDGGIECGVRINDKQSPVNVQINSGQQENQKELVNQYIFNCSYQPNPIIINATNNQHSAEACQSCADNTILNYSISSQDSWRKPMTKKTKNKEFLHQKKSYERKNQQHEPFPQIQQSQDNNKTQQQQLLFNNLIQRDKQLEQKLNILQLKLKSQNQSIQLQRKANQIYTQFYHTLTKIISQFLKVNDLTESKRTISAVGSSQLLNQTLNMDKVIQTVGTLIQSYQKNSTIINSKQTFQHSVQTSSLQTFNNNNNNTQFNYVNSINQLQHLIEEKNHQIIKLKSQLLQSTQNNINAIFNTQLSTEYCLEHQIRKINTQMTNLKEKINLLFQTNNQQQSHQCYTQPQIIYLPQPNIQPKLIHQNKSVNKFINIQSSDDQQNIQQNQQPLQKMSQKPLSRNSNKYSQSKSQKQISSSSSMLSSKETKKRQEMSRREIEQLKQTYSQTKNELNALVNAFSMISSSQFEIRSYFNQVKEGLLREVHEKLERINEYGKDEIDKRIKEERRKQEKGQRLIEKLELEYKQIIEQKQSTYHKQLESLRMQHVHDQQTISELNNMLIQLSQKTSIPERVTQQLSSKPFNPQLIHQQQLPTSQISVSVDCLRLLETLKEENHRKQQEITYLLRQNVALKKEVQSISVVQDSNIKRKNIYFCDLKERKGSIINQLNELPKHHQASTLLPLLTKQGFELQSKKFYGKVKEGLESLEYIESPNIKMQQIQNSTQLQSQRNQASNMKAILQSRQAQIKNHQKQILNLQQTTEYLKQQLSLRQKTIKELEAYICNLQNRQSQNNSSMSPKGINSEPEINLYRMNEKNNNIESMKMKYQNYVKNLKLLLKETQNQNHLLKLSLLSFQKHSITQKMDTSVIHSSQITKNFQTSTSPTNQRSLTQIVMRKKRSQNPPLGNQIREQRMNTFSQ